MARTNKEIQKEIEQLREIDRVTTIKINQEFKDRAEQKKKSADQELLEEKEKINKAIKEEKEEEERQRLNDLFNCFAQAQLETIKETEQTKEFDERLKKFINKL